MTMNNKAWAATDIPSQAGRRVLITGINSGIGFTLRSNRPATVPRSSCWHGPRPR